MAAQFRDTWYSKAPPWMQDGDAEKYMYTLQLCTDLLLEKMNQATKIRMPGQGDPSQIPYLAFDRQLLQGPGEPDDQFIQRLQGAFAAWAKAGARIAILGQLQAYLVGVDPGVSPAYPQMAIVGGSYPTVSTWDVVAFDTPSIALANGVPAKTTKAPANWDWDGGSQPWRAWLILYMDRFLAAEQGTTATITADGGGSYTQPGQNVAGVWVPATSGTPVNAPFLTVDGLVGMDDDDIGNWMTISGSANPTNNGTFQIVDVVSATEAVIVNKDGVSPDAGPLTWGTSGYPYIGPALAWGAPSVVFGQGQLTIPPKDTGANVGGIWQPTETGNQGSLSWGLDVPGSVIQTIRGILQAWKSAGTWYHDIIIAFDEGGAGVAGTSFSPNSQPGMGNPDGSFGPRGQNVNGVWVPTRLVANPYTAWCQGTGTWSGCSVPNRT